MLTHPRHWRANYKENTIDNIKRLFEGIKWGLCSNKFLRGKG